MIIIPKKNYQEICENYLRLTEQEYYVIGIEADFYRIVDSYYEPTLFEKNIFECIDFQDSIGWVTHYDAEGARYSYEPPMGNPGFFEDYYDGVKEVFSIVKSYVEKVEQSRGIKIGLKSPVD